MFHATLQQLRLFQAVAEHQSYTRAAEAVHLSQPAVSIQVKRLEEQLGTALFEKLGRRIYLTPAGAELFDACGEIFGRLARVETVLEGLRGEGAGPLRIGVVTTAKYILPHLLGAFLRRHPKVEPQLTVSNRARILQRLDNNRDDLYIFGHALAEREAVDHPFLDDRLVLFASPRHPLAGERATPVAALARERLLFREQGSGIRTTLEAFLAEHGVEAEPYMELGSGEAIKQAVMADIGIGMLSIQSLRLELETGRLVILDVVDLPIRRKWRVVYPKGKQLSPAAERFVAFVEEHAAELLPCCEGEA